MIDVAPRDARRQPVILAAPSPAETVHATPTGFEIKRDRHRSSADPRVWSSLFRPAVMVGHEHTYSDDSANLSSTLSARLLLREIPKTKGIDRAYAHPRLQPPLMLRMRAARPLQAEAVNGTLTSRSPGPPTRPGTLIMSSAVCPRRRRHPCPEGRRSLAPDGRPEARRKPRPTIRRRAQAARPASAMTISSCRFHRRAAAAYRPLGRARGQGSTRSALALPGVSVAGGRLAFRRPHFLLGSGKPPGMPPVTRKISDRRG